MLALSYKFTIFLSLNAFFYSSLITSNLRTYVHMYAGVSSVTVVTNDKGRLSAADIERMVKDAEKYAQTDTSPIGAGMEPDFDTSLTPAMAGLPPVVCKCLPPPASFVALVSSLVPSRSKC